MTEQVVEAQGNLEATMMINQMSLDDGAGGHGYGKRAEVSFDDGGECSGGPAEVSFDDDGECGGGPFNESVVGLDHCDNRGTICWRLP